MSVRAAVRTPLGEERPLVPRSSLVLAGDDHIYERVERKVNPLVESNKAVEDSVKAEHEATLAYVRAPVGETSAPLYSYFALVADDPSVQIVSKAQTWYVSDLLKDGEYKDLPVLSAAAPFKAGGRGGPEYYTDVPAGTIAIKNVADLYLYPNTVRAVLVTGAEVKDWLERSAGMFNQITAPVDGVVESVNVAKGDQVNAGAVMLKLTVEGADEERQGE